MITKYAILIVLLVFTAHPAVARLGWYPDFDELAEKSDVIVIAEDTGVRDLNEIWVLPNSKPEIKVVGVETTFKVVVILKGELPKTFVLHHYRLPTADAHGHLTMINGPGLVTFLGDKQRYLMFLNKEPDGHYSPGSGQTDPNCSIRPIGDVMWMFKRGNLFVPVLRCLLFWIRKIGFFLEFYRREPKLIVSVVYTAGMSFSCAKDFPAHACNPVVRHG